MNFSNLKGEFISNNKRLLYERDKSSWRPKKVICEQSVNETCSTCQLRKFGFHWNSNERMQIRNNNLNKSKTQKKERKGNTGEDCVK